MSRSMTVLAVAGLLVAGACGGDGGTPSDGGQGSGLVSFSVVQADLPSGFELVADESGPIDAESCISRTESGQTGGGAAVAAKMREGGLVGCHGSKFRKQTEGSTSEVGTAAYQLRDAAAGAAFYPEITGALRQAFTANLTVTDLPAPGVGEESVAVQATQAGNPVEGVVVVWRKGAVVTTLVSFHLDPEFDPQNIIDLAKRINDRASV